MKFILYIKKQKNILINSITKYHENYLAITKQLIDFELIMFRLVDKHEKS